MEPKEVDTTELVHSLKDASTLTEPSKCLCNPADLQKEEDDCSIAPSVSLSAKEMDQSPQENKSVIPAPVEVVQTAAIQNAEDISQADQEAGHKSEDEGFDSLGSSGLDSSSEDNAADDKEKEVSRRKDKSAKDSSDSSEDEDGGLGSEAAEPVASTATIAKSKSEKDIKNKILSILNEAKAKENGGRNVRNYGRTFEHAVQLKPVLVNDKRPEKARRMDNLWCQSVARRQGTNFNGVEVAAKPVAARGTPWSQRANNAAVKKDSVIYNTEVEEFERCRKNLETTKQTGKSVAVVSKGGVQGKSILKIASGPTKGAVTEKQQSSEKAVEEMTPEKARESIPFTEVSLSDKYKNCESEGVLTESTSSDANPLSHQTREDEKEESKKESQAGKDQSTELRSAKLPTSDVVENASAREKRVPSVPERNASAAPLRKITSVPLQTPSAAAERETASVPVSNSSAAAERETASVRNSSNAAERETASVPIRNSSAAAVGEIAPWPVRNASAAPVGESSTPLVIPSTPITRRRADLGPSLLMPAPRAGTN